MSLHPIVKAAARRARPLLSRVCVVGTLVFVIHVLNWAWPGAASPGVLRAGAFLVAVALSTAAGFAFPVLFAPLLVPQANQPLVLMYIILASSLTVLAMSLWGLRHQVTWRGVWPFLSATTAMLAFALSLMVTGLGDLASAGVGLVLLVQGIWLALLATPGVAASAGRTPGGAPSSSTLSLPAWRLEPRPSRRGGVGVALHLLLMQLLSAASMATLAPPGERACACGAMEVAYVAAASIGTVGVLLVFRRLPDSIVNRLGTALLISAGSALLLR